MAAVQPAPEAVLPPVNDRHRFPPLEVCRRAQAFNRALVTNLVVERMVWGPQWEQVFDVTIAEARALSRAWGLLGDAQVEWSPLSGDPDEPRRQALARYRALVGQDAYDRGDLPPYYPTWRFRGKK